LGHRHGRCGGGRTLIRPRALLSGSLRRLTSSASSNSESSCPTRRIRDATGEDVLARDRSASLNVGWASSHNCCHDVGWVIVCGHSLTSTCTAPTRYPTHRWPMPSSSDTKEPFQCIQSRKSCRIFPETPRSHNWGKDAYTRMAKA
jgi:hypothetical protein